MADGRPEYCIIHRSVATPNKKLLQPLSPQKPSKTFNILLPLTDHIWSRITHAASIRKKIQHFDSSV